MHPTRKNAVSLFADRATRQWIVLDPDGNFWIVPSTDDCWNQRQPFYPTEETELEPVPGHYKSMLGLPNASEDCGGKSLPATLSCVLPNT